MRFNGEVSFGDVLMIVSFIGTILTVFLRVERRLARLESRVESMWIWFSEQLKELNGGKRD